MLERGHNRLSFLTTTKIPILARWSNGLKWWVLLKCEFQNLIKLALSGHKDDMLTREGTPVLEASVLKKLSSPIPSTFNPTHQLIIRLSASWIKCYRKRLNFSKAMSPALELRTPLCIIPVYEMTFSSTINYIIY